MKSPNEDILKQKKSGVCEGILEYRPRGKVNKEAKSQMKAGTDKTNDSSDTALDSLPYRQNESLEEEKKKKLSVHLSLPWLFLDLTFHSRLYI